MSYFNILQVSTENQIKEHESGYQIIIDTNRFLEYTNEDIRIFYKQINQEKLDLLKKYPTFITYERFEKEISLAQIKNIIYQATEQNIIINYNQLDAIYITQKEDIEFTDTGQSKT